MSAPGNGPSEPSPDFSGGWNYRVAVQHFTDEDEYAVIEVYYRADGAVEAWSERAAAAGGTLAEVAEDLELMRRALDMPVLEHAELPGAGPRASARDEST